jgi:hypothetical protein
MKKAPTVSGGALKLAMPSTQHASLNAPPGVLVFIVLFVVDIMARNLG